MKRATMMAIGILLTACGGGAPAGPNGVAAQACDAFARTRMEGKTYELDLDALAKSMQTDADLQMLKGEIVIQPGTDGEVKQPIECKVRMSADGKTADVLTLTFL
jgi:hypothetical protein